MVGCLVTENTKEMAESESRDFFVWTDDEVETLLKATRKYTEVKVAENRLGGATKQHSDMLAIPGASSSTAGSHDDGKRVKFPTQEG